MESKTATTIETHLLILLHQQPKVLKIRLLVGLARLDSGAKGIDEGFLYKCNEMVQSKERMAGLRTHGEESEPLREREEASASMHPLMPPERMTICWGSDAWASFSLRWLSFRWRTRVDSLSVSRRDADSKEEPLRINLCLGGAVLMSKLDSTEAWLSQPHAIRESTLVLDGVSLILDWILSAASSGFVSTDRLCSLGS